MTAWVTYYIIVQIDDIILYVTLEAEEKARLHVYTVLVYLLSGSGGGLVSRPHCIYLLRCGSCLHHICSPLLSKVKNYKTETAH